MNKRKLLALLLAAILIAGYILIRTLFSMQGMKVEMAIVEIGEIEDYYTEEGILSFGGEYTVIAKVSGSVKEVCVQKNSLVEAGDILFVVDDRDIQYEKDLYESTIVGLKARLEQSRIEQLLTSSPQEYINSLSREMNARAAEYQSAKTVYEGSETLFVSGALSRVDWEMSKAAYEAALAAWEQSRERYNQSHELLGLLSDSGIAETDLNTKFYSSAIEALHAEIQVNETMVVQLENKLIDCIVTADRDGIVTSLPIEEMDVIQSGATAVVINGIGKAQAEAEVLTSIAPYLTVSEPVTVTVRLRGSDFVYDGQISEVYRFASQGTSALGLDEYRVQVKIDMNDEAGELAHMDGYDVAIRFRLYSESNRLWAPASAVFNTDGQDYVFLVVSGQAVKTPVEVEYKTGTQVVFASGVEAGASLVKKVDTEGVYDGARVHE